MKHNDRGTYRYKELNDAEKLAKKRILCIQYRAQSGDNCVMRSAPMSFKEAHRRKKEYVALSKGDACWIEKVGVASD